MSMQRQTQHFRLTPGELSSEQALTLVEAIRPKTFDPNGKEFATTFGRDDDRCLVYLRHLPKSGVTLKFLFSIKFLTNVQDGEETWTDSGKLSVAEKEGLKFRVNWMAIDKGYKDLLTDEVLGEILELAGVDYLDAGSLEF